MPETQTIVTPNQDDIILSWNADEYLHHERSVVWYIIGIVAVVLLIIYAVLSQSWSMAIAVGLMGAVLYLYSHEVPDMKEIHVTKLGIHFGNKYYAYQDLKAFWFINDQNYKAVVLEINKKTKPSLVIQVPEENMAEIREVLLAQLPEDEGKEESFFDKFGRYLKL